MGAVLRESVRVLLKASALQKYGGVHGGGHGELGRPRRSSYFIRKVARRISRKHDEGEEGIRAVRRGGRKENGSAKRGGEGKRAKGCTAWRGEARGGVITSTRPLWKTYGSWRALELVRGRGLNKRLNIPSINFKRCKISANSMVGRWSRSRFPPLPCLYNQRPYTLYPPP